MNCALIVDIDDPISNDSRASEAVVVDEASVETLISFGFQEDLARKALKASVRFWLNNLPFIYRTGRQLFSNPLSTIEAIFSSSCNIS